MPTQESHTLVRAQQEGEPTLGIRHAVSNTPPGHNTHHRDDSGCDTGR